MIFIDGSNLFYAAKENEIKIHTKKLAIALTSERNLRRVYYYTGYDPKDKKQQDFLNITLKKEKIEVRSRELVVRDGILVEKGIDILMAVDMLKLCYNKAYDTAILVSGDEDFCELVEAVKSFGAVVEVASFSNSLSKKLTECADKTIYLDEIVDKIEI